MHLRFVVTPSSSSGHVENRSRSRGRPSKLYADCSSKPKKRRLHAIRDKYNQELLQAGIAFNNETRYKFLQSNNEQDEETFVNKTLSMYMDLGLSRKKYELLRTYNKHLSGNKFYLPYAKIQAAKKMLPSKYNYN